MGLAKNDQLERLVVQGVGKRRLLLFLVLILVEVWCNNIRAQDLIPTALDLHFGVIELQSLDEEVPSGRMKLHNKVLVDQILNLATFYLSKREKSIEKSTNLDQRRNSRRNLSLMEDQVYKVSLKEKNDLDSIL